MHWSQGKDVIFILLSTPWFLQVMFDFMVWSLVSFVNILNSYKNLVLLEFASRLCGILLFCCNCQSLSNFLFLQSRKDLAIILQSNVSCCSSLLLSPMPGLGSLETESLSHSVLPCSWPIPCKSEEALQAESNAQHLTGLILPQARLEPKLSLDELVLDRSQPGHER